MGISSWRATTSRVLLAGAISAAAVAGTVVAHAEPDPGLTAGEQQFVNDLTGVGLTPKSGNRAMVAAGYSVCSDLSGGKTREYVTQTIYASVAGSTPDQAKAVVDFAAADLCPAAPPVSAGRDQASAERAVKDAYAQKVANCQGTRNEVPDVKSISWDAPGYSEETGGSGIIHDANPDLGQTEFLAMWMAGRWDVQILAC